MRCHHHLDDVIATGYAENCMISSCQCILVAGHSGVCLTVGHNKHYIEWEIIQEGKYITVISELVSEKKGSAREKAEGYESVKAAE